MRVGKKQIVQYIRALQLILTKNHVIVQLENQITEFLIYFL